MAQRTAQVNQIRGLLLEYGIAIPRGRAQVRKRLPLILEDADNGLTMCFRGLLSTLYDELARLDERIGDFDRQIEQLAQADECARRLLTIPGIGPKGSTALMAAIGDINAFNNGRE